MTRYCKQVQQATADTASRYTSFMFLTPINSSAADSTIRLENELNFLKINHKSYS